MPVEVEIEPAPPTEVVPLTPPESQRWKNLPWARALLCTIPSLAVYAFGAPITASILLLAPALVLFRARVWGCALLALVAPVVLALTGVAVTEYSTRVSALEEKRRSHGPGAFTARDLLSIWETNVALAAGGYLCGLPEVATETLIMAWPFGPDTVRFDGDFAMRSPRVRAAVHEMMLEARASDRERIDLGPKRIEWSRYDVSDSPRVGLALNALTLTAKGRKLGGEWSLDVAGKVTISYPPSGTLKLGPITIHEGLFWVAQERGWMHAYEADWRWSLDESDPRLDDPKPRVSWLEKRLFPR